MRTLRRSGFGTEGSEETEGGGSLDRERKSMVHFPEFPDRVRRGEVDKLSVGSEDGEFPEGCLATLRGSDCRMERSDESAKSPVFWPRVKDYGAPPRIRLTTLGD